MGEGGGKGGGDGAHLYTIGVFSLVRNAQGAILLVRQAYGEGLWTLPGGRLEAGEDPAAGAMRETWEEARVATRISGFLGTYVMPFRGNLVLAFLAEVTDIAPWQPDGEIVDMGWFPATDLPAPMGPFSRVRIRDAEAGHRGVLRVHTDNHGTLGTGLPGV